VRANSKQGVFHDPGVNRLTLAEYSTTWLAQGGTRNRLALKTVQNYENNLRRFILPSFGDSALKSITTPQVKAWHSALIKTQPSQTPKSYRLLSTLMNSALRAQMITRNPCNIVGAGSEHAAERPVIGPDDAKELSEAISPEYAVAFALGIQTQLRIGEVLGLQVGEFDPCPQSQD
jgi:integrase